jgi:hypothetical protein
MSLAQDRASLKNILGWVLEVLTTLVELIGKQLPPRGEPYAGLAKDIQTGLPTIQKAIEDKLTDLDKIQSEANPEWQKLKAHGLTDDQLRWKLALLRTVFASQPVTTPAKKATKSSKTFRTVAAEAPLLKRVLKWVNRLLESLELDIVKEFKEGVEDVVEHQMAGDTLITLGEPRNW